MIILELFLGFLKVGCFSFGGGYGAIPLIRDTVLSHGWMDDELLEYMIGVSESTPGPIMVNLATYVGSETAGLAGAAAATAAVVLPSFLIIWLITTVMKRLLQHSLSQAVLSGLKAGVVGVILATGLWMTAKNLLPALTGEAFDIRAVIIAAVLAAILFVPQYTVKKRISPILLILIAAGMGIGMYGV